MTGFGGARHRFLGGLAASVAALAAPWALAEELTRTPLSGSRAGELVARFDIVLGFTGAA